MPTKFSFDARITYNFTCRDCDLSTVDYLPIPELVYTLSVHLQIHHKIPYPESQERAKGIIRLGIPDELAYREDLDGILKKL